MSRPLVTPSPHRFVLRKEFVKDSNQNEASRSPSSQPRPVSTTPSHPALHSNVASPQFSNTPRFSYAATQTYRTTLDTLTTPSSSITRPSVLRSRGFAVVEEVDSQDELQSQETTIEDQLVVNDEDGDNLREGKVNLHIGHDIHVSKRRRLSPSLDSLDNDDIGGDIPAATAPVVLSQVEESEIEEISATPTMDDVEMEISSSLPEIPPPSTRHGGLSVPSKFLFSPSQQVPRATAPSSSHMPHVGEHVEHFTRAPRFKPVEEVVAPAAAEPLPEIFSPHRRGQKFIPGGLATQTRDWLMNLDTGRFPNVGKTGPVAGLARGVHSASSAKTALVRVQNLQRNDVGNWLLVEGNLETINDQLLRPLQSIIMEGQLVRLVVAGPGTRSVLEPAVDGGLQAGSLIEIRQPMWNVRVEGTLWGVCVEYTVLA